MFFCKSWTHYIFATGDVIIIGITTDSAVISWIIPSFTRSEEYYIQYGSEETELDMTTTPIPSPRDTSLVNQTYSVSLQGLSPGTVYHFRVVAIYDVVFTRYSDQTSFRTYEEGMDRLIILTQLFVVHFFLQSKLPICHS